jgi:death-on-curing protein
MGSTLRFLSVEDVILIHDDTIRNDGGLPGIRDIGLLTSAVMMPQQMFGGEYLHDGIAAMGAAYLFHIARNHPFSDGNKRAGVLAMLVFFEANGVRPLPESTELETVTLSVAAGDLGKEALTKWLRERLKV